MEHYYWSRGILFGDKKIRLDERRATRDEMIVAGGENIAFWRGAVEASGCMGCYPVTGGKFPRLKFGGSKQYLWAILEFLYDRWPMWDRSNQAISQIKHRSIDLQGIKAQEFVAILWPHKDVVTSETNRERAHDIRDNWVPFNGTKARYILASDLINPQVIGAMRKPQPRQPYKHLYESLL